MTLIDGRSAPAMWDRGRNVLRGWRACLTAAPEERDRWGGPFNGQSARRALFHDLVAAFQPAAIVETGTFHATTTEYLAATGLPVFTIETNAYCFGFSLRRLWRRRNVTMLFCDSRAGLRRLFAGRLRRRRGDALLFYLDAHWSADLPLAEEIDCIFAHCPRAVVMIDDFEVPGDPGYAFDDYGGGNVLTESYIRSNMRRHDLAAYYPATRSAAEDGARRGCVVLAKESVYGAVLSSMPLLRSS